MAINEALTVRDKKPFAFNIELVATYNDTFRSTPWTGNDCQVTVMSIPPEGDIGEETHTDGDQLIYVASGTGQCKMNGTSMQVTKGFMVCVPKGTKHNIINKGITPLQLFTVYAPVHHPQGTVHQTKEEATQEI